MKVKFVNYQEHAVMTECATDLQFIEDMDFVDGYGMSLPFVLTREMIWDGISEKPDPMYNIQEEGNWRLMLFHTHNQEFYLSFSYSAIRQSYIVYIMLARNDYEASKYKAKVWVEQVGVENPERRTWMLSVLSIDDVRSENDFLPHSQYLVLPYGQMKRFFSITENEFSFEYLSENGKFTIELPIQVEEIIKEEE